jgi:hypothetical protein
MRPAAIVLIVFGILPIIFAYFFSNWSRKQWLRNSRYQNYRAKIGERQSHVPNTSPVIRAGLNDSASLLEVTEPQFSTLHCRSHQAGEATWQLEIEFEIRNRSTTHDMVIDDVHACLYERNAFPPPYLTIGHFGDVVLRQDNRIVKERRIYSLAPGDGYVMNLMFHASRIEGVAGITSDGSEKTGRAIAVFGLLLDYYVNTPFGLDRRTVPSEALYLFASFSDEVIRSLDDTHIRELQASHASDAWMRDFCQRLESYLAQHRAFSAAPTS